MAQTGNMYANAIAQAFAGAINWSADSIKMGLLGPGYTPNLTGHIHWSDVSASEIAGTNYVAGGQALATKTLTVTAANSWATPWTATTAIPIDDVVVPTAVNGFLYRAAQAGTSGSVQPTFPTVVGETVTDGTVIWTNIGESLTSFGSAAVTWSNSTITAAYAIIYDNQTGVASTSPLIALLNFGGSQSSSSGPFTLTPSTLGWFIWNPA